MKARPSFYSVFLHLALVALCGLTLVLAVENRRLKRQTQPSPNGPTIGQQVEDLRWRPLDAPEDTIDLSSATRDSLLLIFTTDCPACRKTQADWRLVHETIGGSVNVVGLSLSDIESTRSYRNTLVIPFQVGVPTDPSGFAQALSISGVPLTIRIGPNGRVKGKWSGTLSARQLSEVTAP